ncbi:DUF6338 family protein [Neptuniibacter pectenicola]|uniref:DUF6338 family protein n=1 Tax=Neptuniibacter pectenicola TaxID=1806669 RepID=UPI0030EED3D3|tara:strand:+ start:348 stop:953 length:606 start_codon:yes stop_codon:yes gene_type:complete
MNVWDENKLFLFIAFVVPGFVAIKVYELLAPSKSGESSKQLVDAISYSCLNYAILLWPIYLVETSGLKATNLNYYLFFYFSVLFVFPTLLVILWRWLRELEIVQKFVPHPTQKPWDYVFSQRQCHWVIVTLRNGEKIAGMYGPNSFASSAPAEEQLYLEEQWMLNDAGGFERRVEQTSGIIILSSEIMSVEFMHSGENEDG